MPFVCVGHVWISSVASVNKTEEKEQQVSQPSRRYYLNGIRGFSTSLKSVMTKVTIDESVTGLDVLGSIASRLA